MNLSRQSGKPRVFVLDTSVLLHDPASIFRFDEHDIYVPMTVLEKLDAATSGNSELARNAREAARTLGALLERIPYAPVEEGIPLPQTGAMRAGRLFFHLNAPDTDPTASTAPVNTEPASTEPVLRHALSLRTQHPQANVIVVSKDINLRIKAQVLGLVAEDYFSDRSVEDAALLPTGVRALSDTQWQELHITDPRVHQGMTRYRICGAPVRDWHPNLCLSVGSVKPQDFIVEHVGGEKARVREATDYSGERGGVWGVRARNSEQNFALNMLCNPDLELVTLLGTAGTGKTLLALASGLAQTLDDKRYREIVITRVTIAVGEDIGYLPGTEEEKMAPWMGALMDNLEVLTDGEPAGSQWGRAATNELLNSRIKIRSPAFMRGRTFLHRYLIIDEAQNLTSKQLKTLLTRAGPGTKVVCIGNLEQIDTPYLTETTSGLAAVVDRFRRHPFAGHVTLRRGERSRLADAASDVL